MTVVTEVTDISVPRIVRPRKPRATWRPVIALSRKAILTETGQTMSIGKLAAFLRHEPSSIIVAQDFGYHFGTLLNLYEHDETFTYRVTPIERYKRDDPEGRKGVQLDAICNYFGWKVLRENGKTRSTHFHYPLDPVWFLSQSINEIDDRTNVPEIERLLLWATQLRDWCEDEKFKVTPSSGGIAAQLLKDPRFYPEPRRKVPKILNRAARPHLPGNYYELRCTKGKPRNAIMLDMENAHHALAARVRFPDANTLYGYGSVPGNDRRMWTNNREVLRYPGLYAVQVSIPHIPLELFPPPALQKPGSHILAVYSNELSWLESYGVKIEGVWWAITADETEPGLNKYARWAIDTLRENSGAKSWLKPTLHSVYGLLAARPQPFETGFRGNGWTYFMGSSDIPVRRMRVNRVIESSIVNVIHRGMIEAEVRKEALSYARLLAETDRHRILAVYADCLIIEDTGNPIRLLEAPWRVKDTVKHITFRSATTFTSPTISRLPGVPRDSRERFVRQRELSDHLRGARAERAIAPIWQP